MKVNAIKAMYEDGILENIKQIGVEVQHFFFQIYRYTVNAIKAMYEDGILENIKQIGVEVQHFFFKSTGIQ